MSNYRKLSPGFLEVAFRCKGCEIKVCTEVPIGGDAPSLCRKCLNPPKPKEQAPLEKGMSVRIKGHRGENGIGKVMNTPEPDAPVVTVTVGGAWHTYPIDKIEALKIKNVRKQRTQVF